MATLAQILSIHNHKHQSVKKKKKIEEPERKSLGEQVEGINNLEGEQKQERKEIPADKGDF